MNATYEAKINETAKSNSASQVEIFQTSVRVTFQSAQAAESFLYQVCDALRYSGAEIEQHGTRFVACVSFF